MSEVSVPDAAGETPAPALVPDVEPSTAPGIEGGGTSTGRDGAAAPRPVVDGADPDLVRAAALVVATQYASAARLQRELQVPYARARRLLADLEAHRIVGPPTGPTPRQVLLPKDHLADLEQVLAA